MKFIQETDIFGQLLYLNCKETIKQIKDLGFPVGVIVGLR